MLSHFFESPARIRAIRCNPSAVLLEGFADYLFESGYVEISARRHIRSAEHIIHWANRKKLLVNGLDDPALERFGDHLARCCCDRYSRANRVGILTGARLFLRHSQGVDTAVIRMPGPADSKPVLLKSFCDWMREYRGTSELTLYNYGLPIQELIRRLGDDPSKLDAKRLRTFVLTQARNVGWATAKRCTTALRMFLRFLIAEGRCRAGLLGAIPALAHWRLSSLPRYLSPEAVEGVIDSCDVSSPVGKRDRAILLLLARLGLRAGDIVQMRLEDVDWKGAWVHVSGKGRRQTRLPLTQEVGDAIVSYVREGRPPSSRDTLFLRSRAPFRGFRSHAAVSVIVATAIRRAGIKRPGRGAAHLLRHSVASSMLRQGASLQEISVLLRHRSIETTQIYAKIDVTALQQIAQPWPEVVMLARAVQSYLSVRRAAGWVLKQVEFHLTSFAAYSDSKRQRCVNPEIAIEWARQSRSMTQRARRLADVRRFALYLQAENARHEIPPAIFGKERGPRPTPYILTDEQIRRIIQLAAESGYRTLRRQTYSTLFALLACTGLRVSEAIRLRYDDITKDGLIIHATKFRKNRLVPLHDTARAGLERYLKQRRPDAPFDDHVFISLRRKPLLIEDVDVAFRTVAKKMNLPHGRGQRRPTPHSLRHAFAVRALQNCPDGRDRITQHMLMLSTYLGHGKADLTYWYLEAVPELMQSIAERCEAYVTGGRL